MKPTPLQLTFQIGIATLGRFLINTSRRMIYPFASVLSVGLGVPLLYISSLIAINQATGLLSPLFGPLSDRWGYRNMMLLGLGILSFGMGFVGIFPFYWVLVVAMFLAGLSKSIYDPALQSYIGEHVPYQRRGLVIGLMEYSWAGSSLIGLPLVGLLLANPNYDWQTSFLILGGSALIVLGGLTLTIPRFDQSDQSNQNRTFVWQSWRILSSNRSALSLLGFGFFVGMANDILFVIYALWLSQQFGLGVAAIALATPVIGVAELIGETLTATISDRIGPSRVLIGSGILTTIGYFLLPIIGQTTSMALVALFISFILFEFMVVTSFSVATELLPTARATLLSAYLAAGGLGRVIGSLLATVLWSWGQQSAGDGITITSVTIAILNGLGILCFWWGMRRVDDSASQ